MRLADVGWTAETATTAVLGQMLTDLGYKPVITVLSVPVTFESMKNGDIDVFLGNWIPAQESMLKPFTDEGSVEVVRDNLVGAKYTLGRARLSCTTRGSRTSPTSIDSEKSWGHRFTASSPATTATTSSSN